MADARRYCMRVGLKPEPFLSEDVDARWSALYGKLGKPSYTQLVRWQNTWPT